MNEVKLSRSEIINEIIKLLDNLFNYKHDEQSKAFVINSLKIARQN